MKIQRMTIFDEGNCLEYSTATVELLISDDIFEDLAAELISVRLKVRHVSDVSSLTDIKLAVLEKVQEIARQTASVLRGASAFSD